MNIAIADLSFPLSRQGDGLASLWLRYRLTQLGANIVSIPDADVIAATSVSATQAPRARLLRQAAPNAFIALGGAASIEPTALEQYVDVICVGDGQHFLDVLVDAPPATKALPNAWVAGEDRPVTIDNNFPWFDPPIEGEDGATRICLARGCRRKCAFCATGWAYPYQEHPSPQHAINAAKAIASQGKAIAYVTNDLAAHAWASELPPTAHASLSIDAIRQHGLQASKQLRLGIEGISERLRKAVGKPIPAEQLIDITAWLSDNKKRVRWFLIAGLPGETDDDWQELRDTIQAFKLRTTKGVLSLSFTAFHRHPSTPLAQEPIDDTYWQRFESFKHWFFDGPGFSRRIKILKPQTPLERLKTDIALMALTPQQLYAGGHRSPNNRIQYHHIAASAAACDRYHNTLGTRDGTTK